MNGINDVPKRENHEVGDIRFRAIEYKDLELLSKWRNELKHLFREYRDINETHQRQWFESIVKDKRFIHFAIDVWDGQWLLIGSCNLSSINWVDRHAEYGIYIGDPEWRGKGAGVKSMVKLMCVAFYELNMHTVRGEAYEFNPVLRIDFKFGFKEVGRWREAKYHDGRYWDSVLMDITRKEWDKLYAERYSGVNELDTVS
jgi:RimJ/RimL family protein N-acetyltransferase